MLTSIIVLLLGLLVPEHVVDAVRANFPGMTADVAREHAGSAMLGGIVHHVDPIDALAIAAHESKGEHVEATPEPPLDGWAACRDLAPVNRCAPRWSCGVMTPEPLTDRAECDHVRASIAAGYLAGAKHLAAWMRTCRGDRRCAFHGYAGAWTVRPLCGHAGQPRSCAAAAWFVRRAAWIRRVVSTPEHARADS